MDRSALKWFVPLMIVLVLLVVCVVLLALPGTRRTLENLFNPPVTASIYGLDGLPDGERVQVEGYLQNRDRVIYIRATYDCRNYFLSANRSEPYGDTVDLCIARGEVGMYERQKALEGQRARITGLLSFEGSERRLYIYVNHPEDLLAAP